MATVTINFNGSAEDKQKYINALSNNSAYGATLEERRTNIGQSYDNRAADNAKGMCVTQRTLDASTGQAVSTTSFVKYKGVTETITYGSTETTECTTYENGSIAVRNVVRDNSTYDIKSETYRYRDGTVSVTETAANGDKVRTTTTADGAVIVTEEKKPPTPASLSAYTDSPVSENAIAEANNTNAALNKEGSVAKPVNMSATDTKKEGSTEVKPGVDAAAQKEAAANATAGDGKEQAQVGKATNDGNTPPSTSNTAPNSSNTSGSTTKTEFANLGKTTVINKQVSANTSDKSDELLSAAAPDIASNSYTDPKTDVFHLDATVYIEGVEVPYNQCSVSYGIGEPPTCTLVIPANNFLRELPATTKVLVTHKDLLPDKNGEYKQRVLFDGELASYSYSIDPSGATIQISAIHCCAYLTFMQLMCQEAREYMTDPTWQQLGDSVCMLKSVYGSLQVCLVGAIITEKSSSLKSMADLVYIMLNYLINESTEYSRAGVTESSTSKWYHAKLGNVYGGYKILNRIYGVSEAAKNAGKLGDYTKNWKDALAGKAPGVSVYEGNYSGGGVVNASTKNIFDTLCKVLPNVKKAGICIIMGSIQCESNFNIACGGDASLEYSSNYIPGEASSFGLHQWHIDKSDTITACGRGEELMKWCNSHGGSWNTNMEGQCSFLAQELQRFFPKLYQEFCNMDDSIEGINQVSPYNYVRRWRIDYGGPDTSGPNDYVKEGPCREYAINFYRAFVMQFKGVDDSQLPELKMQDVMEDAGLSNTNSTLVKNVRRLNAWCKANLGAEIQISGGRRSVSHNAEVNGDKNSLHLTGHAVDFVCPPEWGWTQDMLSQLEAHIKGVGFNNRGNGDDLYHDKGSGYHFHVTDQGGHLLD